MNVHADYLLAFVYVLPVYSLTVCADYKDDKTSCADTTNYTNTCKHIHSEII